MLKCEHLREALLRVINFLAYSLLTKRVIKETYTLIEVISHHHPTFNNLLQYQETPLKKVKDLCRLGKNLFRAKAISMV